MPSGSHRWRYGARPVALYPPIEPHDHGLLDVGDGNQVHWEVCGRRDGQPVVVLHGGPGSGCTSVMRRYFDPAAFRIVLFDQRGCGRSTPHASDPATDLSVNTTAHLLTDIERVRRHLGIDRWMVFGNSWGSTLGLVYAERHPDRVSGVVLAGVTTTRPSEIDWLYRGAARFFPAEWARFRDALPVADRDGDLLETHHQLLGDPDPEIRVAAAEAFSAWEWALTTTDPDARRPARWEDPSFLVGRARVVTHYFRHHAWLDDGAVLRDAAALAHIRGVLVHGRWDFGAPLAIAWELAQVWPAAELVVVDVAGHSTGDAGMADAIVAATDRMRT